MICIFLYYFYVTRQIRQCGKIINYCNFSRTFELKMLLGHNLKRRRTQDVKISQNVTFETMLLNEITLQGLKHSGFYKPSPIQLHGIPLGKCGFDLLLEAKSGTGKTAVFTVIALEKINLNNGLQAVILAPTREIAAQICDVIKQIGSQYEGLVVEVVMGGLPVKDDIEKLKNKVHILVGSPGRLHHLIKDKHIDTSAVRLLVLDEADKLLEKSFRADIDFIFSTLPQQKQIIFSSATFPDESKPFINQYIQLHQHICPDSNNVLLGIEQKVTVVNYNTNIVRQTQHRFEELLNILSKKEFKQCLIFCNYQARVTDLHKMLKKAKWPAERLYGQQEQTDRLEALKTLQEYKCRILIATDLAARGLDSSHVDLVINFEPPHEWQTYLHRIGRAGRFGSYGLAVTILNTREQKQFKEVLNALQFQIDIRNFWTDDKYEYSELDNSEISEQNDSLLNSDEDIAVKDECTDFWDAMTAQAAHNSLEIETFDDLCKSFQEAVGEVEPITDLLDSLQNAHIDDKNDENEHKEQSKYIEKDISEVPTPVPKDLSIEEKEHKYSSKIIEETESKEDEFSSIVRKDKIPPTTTQVTKNNNKNKHFGASPRKSYHAYVMDSFSSDESVDCGYNTASYDYKRLQCNSASNERFTVPTQSNNCYSNSSKVIAHKECQSKMHGYTQNYINWYQYLKFRTKQIEMAVYINEMSKL